MSATLDLLVELHHKGIHLRVAPNGELGYEGPEDLVTEEVVTNLRNHKAELRTLLEWDEEQAYALIQQALRYLGKYYVKNPDLSALNPWEDRVNESYAQRDMGALRVAIRGFVRAGLTYFEKSHA